MPTETEDSQVEPTQTEPVQTENPQVEPTQKGEKPPLFGYESNMKEVPKTPPVPGLDHKGEPLTPKEEPQGSDDKDKVSIYDVKGIDHTRAKTLNSFIKDHDLPEQAVKDLMKAEEHFLAESHRKTQASQAEEIQRITDIKTGWVNEIKGDQKLGYQNYQKTMDTVGTFMRDHLPLLSKELVETGGMPTPSLIRDIVALHDKLKSTTSTNMEGYPAGESNNKTMTPAEAYYFNTMKPQGTQV